MIDVQATREKLEVVFKDGAPIRGVNQAIIGRGFFERDLVAFGFEKRELKKLVELGVLDRVTTRWQGGWRNTYVMRCIETETAQTEAQGAST